MEKITLKIPGMMCMHCVGSVIEALNGVAGLTEVTVDLATKTASFIGDKQAAIDAIDAIGFDVEG